MRIKYDPGYKAMSTTWVILYFPTGIGVAVACCPGWDDGEPCPDPASEPEGLPEEESEFCPEPPVDGLEPCPEELPELDGFPEEEPWPPVDEGDEPCPEVACVSCWFGGVVC